MEQLQQRMASLGQDKEGEGQEIQAKDSSVKSPGSSNDFFHETGEFQFNELRHRAPKPDDEKGLLRDNSGKGGDSSSVSALIFSYYSV